MSDHAERGTAIVTGASRGIGRAIARRLAGQFEVVALARTDDELRSLAAEIEHEGGRCRPRKVDVTDPVAVERALGGEEAAVVVNNAGVGNLKPMLELSLDEWHNMVAVNLNAVFYVCRAALPGMMRRGGGHIVNIGSLASRTTFVGGSCYAATKHALLAFSESLWLEVRARKVLVTVVMPGSVATELRTGAQILAGAGDTSWMLTPDDVAATVADVVTRPTNVLLSRIEIRPNAPPPKGA